MELNEGAQQPPVLEQDELEDPYKFKAAMVSVEFESPVRAFLDGAEVTTPNWAAGIDVLDDWSERAKRIHVARTQFSKRPAVYTPKNGTMRASIKFKVTQSETVGDEGELVGTLGPLRISGECEIGVGEQEVYAKIDDAWKGAIDARVGDIQWAVTLKSPGFRVSLGTTFVEVYMLLADPADMYKRKVPVETLRLLTQKVGVVGKTASDEVAIAVTRYLHKSHGLSYDTMNGKSAHDVSELGGGGFPVVDYTLRSKDVINCYDQAAGVQALSGAVGAQVKWLFMDPYGFIKPTHLVGDSELCNNPFYRSPHPHDQVVTNLKKIDPKDIHRFPFGNHAFCALPYQALPSALVLDACAGPELASQTLKDHVNEDIDHDEVPRKHYQKLTGRTLPTEFEKDHVAEPDGITSVTLSSEV